MRRGRARRNQKEKGGARRKEEEHRICVVVKEVECVTKRLVEDEPKVVKCCAGLASGASGSQKVIRPAAAPALPVPIEAATPASKVRPPGHPTVAASE